MFNILTLNKISQNGLKHLPDSRYSVSDKCDAPEGIILRSFAMHDYELPQSLLGIARAGAGVNNIPLDKCSEAGIVVFNTPGANANGVKELVLAGMLLSARDIVGGVTWIRGLEGQTEVAAKIEKGKAAFGGTEISGKKLGVIGLGAIGVLVANAASALGMEVIGYDPFLSDNAKNKLLDCVKYDATLDEIYSSCDYITLHVPYNNDTKGMINAASLAKCKKGVKILNFARAELVNNAELKKALEDGIAGKYVTDFPNEETLGVKGIITIPHLGASTEESEENCAEMAAKQLKRYLETGCIVNSVNFPAFNAEPSGKSRLCVFHRDIEGAASKFAVMAEGLGLKVLNAQAVKKNGYAYTVIDLDGKAPEGLLESVGSAEGTLKARIIEGAV
jgi:D-3-phosphoglycerate dehydrogenase